MARPVKLDVPNLTFTEDYTVWDKIKADFKYLHTMHIEYGIVNNDKYPAGDPRGRDGTPVAEIFRRNELGLNTDNGVNLPPRPAFKQSTQGVGKYRAIVLLQHIAYQAGAGVFQRAMLHDAAKKMADTVRQEIDAQNLKPLSRLTIREKDGNTKPLRDTDVLYHAIDGRVKRGNINYVKKQK